MTKKEAKAEFDQMNPRKDFIHPAGYLDTIARDEAWSNFTDRLRTEGRITDQQYRTWEYS